MFNVLQKIKDSERNIYIITGLFCFLLFVVIYGYQVLNPVYTDWLYITAERGSGLDMENLSVSTRNMADLTQHYLGWKAYRESGWHFPIGMTDTLAYPSLTTVIFTDSIPLFAVFFKILSPILPAQFQYFGLWGALCFILQGIMAVRILKNYSTNKCVLVLSGVLFAVTPAMLWRMFVHTALAGQWILLFALEPLFAYDKYRDNNGLYGMIALMAVFAAGTHIYFILMCGIILLGILLLDICRGERWKRAILLLVEYIGCSAFVVWILGGFNTKMTPSEEGLGIFSFNLSEFFNPKGWSCLATGHAGYSYYQYEGFSYLGAGCQLLMTVCAIMLLLRIREKNRLEIKWNVKWNALLLVSVISIVIAASPIVTCGNKVLFTMVLPDIVNNAWAVFRSSGRIVWVAMYIIMISLCILAYKLEKKGNVSVVLFAVVVSLQVFDIHSVLMEKHEIFANKAEYHSELETKAFWGKLAENKEIKHVLYYSEMSNEFMFSVTDWALDCGKTVNDFYFARFSRLEVEKNRYEILADLPSDYIVIFKPEDAKQCQNMGLYSYSVDGVVVGSPQMLMKIN